MIKENIIYMIHDIIEESAKMIASYADSSSGELDHVSIFSHNSLEYHELLEAISEMAKEKKKTEKYILFRAHKPLTTKIGSLKFIKLYKPYSSRPKGMVALIAKNFDEFRKKYANRRSFRTLIDDSHMIIELCAPGSDVLVHFMDAPIQKDIGI